MDKTPAVPQFALETHSLNGVPIYQRMHSLAAAREALRKALRKAEALSDETGNDIFPAPAIVYRYVRYGPWLISPEEERLGFILTQPWGVHETEYGYAPRGNVSASTVTRTDSCFAAIDTVALMERTGGYHDVVVARKVVATEWQHSPGSVAE
jgi:hypothetical protein